MNKNFRYSFQGFFALIGHASQIIQGSFEITDTIAPTYSNLRQSSSNLQEGHLIKLSSYWTDNEELNYTWLATNETGQWENKTFYGSPKVLSGSSDWSNFTWQNSSIFIGMVISWKVYGNDTSGNENSTEINSFRIVEAEVPSSGPSGAGASFKSYTSPCVYDLEIDVPSQTNIYQEQELVVIYKLLGRLTNNGTCSLSDISLEILRSSGVCDFTYSIIPEQIDSLNKSQSKAVLIEFSSPVSWEDHECRINIEIDSNNIRKEKEIGIVIKKEPDPANIISIPTTMDMSVVILSERVEDKGPVEFLVSLHPYLQEGQEKVDTYLMYIIRDISTREVILHEEDILTIKGPMSFTKNISLKDSGIGLGRYYLDIIVGYDNRTISEVNIFQVVRSPLLFITLISVVIILLFLVIRYLQSKRKKRGEKERKRKEWEKLYKKWE